MKMMDPLFNSNLNNRYSEKKFFEVFDSFGNISRSKYVRLPLSEYDILDLQEKFLSNGIHHITVDSLEIGRALIKTFVSSMHCYHENAILSTSFDAASTLSGSDISFVDIYCELIQGGYIEDNKNFKFNDFFVDQFFYDFMLIEASEDLIDNSWFLKFFTSIKNCEIDRHMPIFVISYTR